MPACAMYDIIITGGGAAGMMAAAAAAASGSAGVALLEKNEKLGKKIYITGKGRCNYTNACDMGSFMENIVSNPRFMYSSLKAFGPADMTAFLESAGCRTTVERGMRAFPLSGHASDVTRALEKKMLSSGVDIRLGTGVSSIRQGRDKDGKALFIIEAFSGGKKAAYSCRRLIIATGGLSYPSTGSTGDGYRFASGLGHRIKETVPSLTAIELEEADSCRRLQGVSLKNVTLAILDEKGKKVYDAGIGELLFTHFGISGPLSLRASSHIAGLIAGGEKLFASIDLKPALDEKKLDERLLKDLGGAKNAAMKNALSGLLISSLRPVLLERSGIDPGLRAGELKRGQRLGLLHEIKNFGFRVRGLRGFEEAVITRGGVMTDEINPKTMESKLVKGLYFAGEVLDVDAHTGGFNLQIAWSTGHAAGTAAAASLMDS